MRACLVMLALLAGCAPAPANAPAGNYVAATGMNAPDMAPDMSFDDNVEAHRSREPPRYSGPAYFPAALGEPTVACRWDRSRLQPILSDFTRDWYSRQLAAAREPSLYRVSRMRRPAGAATLRLTWLRSFHPPVTIRIETADPHRQRLVAKQMSGAGGYDPGHVAKTLDRPLTADESARLRAMLARTRVFDLARDPCDGGTDGAQWIFESVDAGGYHYFDVWTPRTGPANELGRFLMGLTGWDFGRVY